MEKHIFKPDPIEKDVCTLCGKRQHETVHDVESGPDKLQLQLQLQQEREARERAERERDRYAQLLRLTTKILEQVPDTQAKDEHGKVWDGDHLAAEIQDVLEGKHA